MSTRNDMARSRLDDIAPLLAKRFRKASREQRRQAALIACEQVVLGTGVAAAEVSEALAVLRGAAVADVSLRARLESGVASFDYDYFRLHDDESFEPDGSDAEKQQARANFSKARAMSALAFALIPDDSQLHEALYESLFALGSPAELVHLLENALG